MLLDGHSTPSVCERLGLSHPNLLYKRKLLQQASDHALPVDRRVQ
jgi:hypothetical protein